MKSNITISPLRKNINRDIPPDKETSVASSSIYTESSDGEGHETKKLKSKNLFPKKSMADLLAAKYPKNEF